MIKSNAKLHLHKFWVGFDAVFIRKRKGGNWCKEEILLALLVLLAVVVFKFSWYA